MSSNDLVDTLIELIRSEGWQERKSLRFPIGVNMKLFKFTKVKHTVVDLVPVGLYLVEFTAIWGSRCSCEPHTDDCLDHGTEYVADIEPSITRVTEKNYENGTFQTNVINKDETLNDDFKHDDTHDLRPRLFKKKRDALEHTRFTMDRFKNPQPWESFVEFK